MNIFLDYESLLFNHSSFLNPYENIDLVLSPCSWFDHKWSYYLPGLDKSDYNPILLISSEAATAPC